MKSKKIIFKLIFDLCMFVTLMLLYKKNIISLAFHEIAGLLVLAAMLIHVLINGNWVKAVTGKLFQKEFSAKQKVNWIVDFLELIVVIGMIVTSLLVNKRTFPAIGNHNSVNPYHFFFAALLLVLVGIHVGLHFSFIKNSVCGAKKSTVAGKIILIVYGVITSGFGIYSLCTTSFLRWLKGPFTSTADMHMKMHGGGAPDAGGIPGMGGGRPPVPAFSFPNLLLLFAQMACIALLFGIIAFGIQSILKKNDNKEKVLH